MKSRVAPERSFSLDYLMWLFTRVSALLMYLFAIIGITGALLYGARQQMDLGALLRWTFTPSYSHIQSTGIVNQAAFDNSFWQIMAILFVLFAGSHGLNGVRVVIEDYLNPAWARILLRCLILVIWLFMTIIGIYVIQSSFTFSAKELWMV